MSVSNEFSEFVLFYVANGWNQPIQQKTLEVDGVTVPVHEFWAGRNSSHEFYICQEIDGPRYFRVSAGPTFTPVEELTEKDLAYIEDLRKNHPYSMDEVILDSDGKGKVIGLDKWKKHVTVCSDLQTAVRAYLGHF